MEQSSPIDNTPLPRLHRLPDTLTGPARLRRRRRLVPEWTQCTARLNGTALVLLSIPNRPGVQPTVLAALDVYDVHRLHYPSSFGIVLLIRSCAPGVAARLRFEQRPETWATVLFALSRARAPKLNDFMVISPVGKGGGGEVYLVREKPSHTTERPSDPSKPLAMKVVQKNDAFGSDNTLRHALDERLVLELVRGFPFVVQLTHAFQTQSALYMVSEFCIGGDLRAYLRKQHQGKMAENAYTKRIMAQVALALDYVHSLNVIYRDIKPDNVLLTADGDARLCDFGLSKVLTNGKLGRTKSFCGSTSYMSPQIVAGKTYSIATDLWSLGALYFRILVGRAPFDQDPTNLDASNDSVDVHRRIQQTPVLLPSALSLDAKEMLTRLLTKREDQRMNIPELRACGFFRDIDWRALLDEGYSKMGASYRAQGHELDNFDSQRLISHGVALRDKELRGERFAKKRIGGKREFIARRASMMIPTFGRKPLSRPNHTRTRASTSIIGFGYAQKDDPNSNHTESDPFYSISAIH